MNSFTKIVLILPILAVCLGGCKSPKVIRTEFYPMKKLLVEEDFTPPLSDAGRVEILDVMAKDSILIINVKYYAGEDLTDFDLVTDGKLIKTLPPIISLYLRTHAPGQEGKKLVFQELQFNMGPARRWEADEVVFQLAGHKGEIKLKL